MNFYILAEVLRTAMYKRYINSIIIFIIIRSITWLNTWNGIQI